MLTKRHQREDWGRRGPVVHTAGGSKRHGDLEVRGLGRLPEQGRKKTRPLRLDCSHIRHAGGAWCFRVGFNGYPP